MSTDLTLSAKTLCEAFQDTVKRTPDTVALRTPGDAVRITWRAYGERVERIATGLHALGVRSRDTVALMMSNRPEFNLCDTAAMHLGATPYSIYSTLPIDDIHYLFTNAESRVVFCEAQFLDRILEAAKDTSVAHVVCIDAQPTDHATAVSLEALEGKKPSEPFEFAATWRAVEPGDVLTLIYTSGTTGRPKGVELTHANLLAELHGVADLLPIKSGDRITSYLPSAHIADRWSAHYSAMAWGIEVTCVSDTRAIGAALVDVRPTIWGGVPRVWEKLKAGLEAAFARETDEAKKKGIAWAFDVGIRKVRAEQDAYAGQGSGPSTELLLEYKKADQAVFSAIRAKIGLDQLRWAVSGAAPIPNEVLEFFTALGIPIAELWGMSELSCCATINPLSKMRIGTVGIPIPGLELKIAEDGELLVRGPTVMKGYRREPEKTKETVDAEGWLATGDVARIDPDGYVRIVDRKKELIINAAGKNMSPANIEHTIKAAHPLIGQAVCIGDRRPYNVALVVLDPDRALVHAEQHGLPSASVAAIATHPSVEAAIKEAMAAANAKLSRVEQIKHFAVLPVQWDPGGDELTPTMKLKRKPIAQKYAREIDALYTHAPPAEG